MLLAYGFLAAYAISVAAVSSLLIALYLGLLRRNALLADWTRRSWRVLRPIFAIYVAVLIGGFGYQLLFSRPAESLNGTETGPREEGLSVPDELLARLRPPGTLVLVSLSGGGSRAAYFAAAILEGLREFHLGDKSGIDSSLVYNIALISSVSGGSLAGAYFTASLPDPTRAEADQLARFFSDFKQAMAENFEARILRQLVDPRYTLAYLTLQRSVASGLAGVFDSALLGGRRLTFAELDRDAVQKRRPLFVPNATDLNDLSLTAFAGSGLSTRYGGDIIPSGRPDPRDNRIIPWASDLPGTSIKYVTFSLYHALDDFPVAEAVAASAAFPFLGFIDVFMPHVSPHSILHLADGGLVDNSGLLSLYALTFKRALFERASGSLHRVVLISIDSSADSSLEEDRPGVTDELAGIYTLQQRYAELFVAPWLHRLFGEELSGLFPVGTPPSVTFPPPIVFSYALCGTADPSVPTAFHLTRSDRDALDRAARTCIETNRRSLEAALNKPYVPVSRYGGALKEADYNARSALVTLAYDERYFAADRGSWAVGEGFRRPAEVWWRPRAGRDGSKLARSESEVKLASELTTEKTGFVFDARTEGDSLVLSATPERYGKSGFVSLRLRITPEMVRETNEDDFCVVSYEAIRGGDYAGNPAPDTAEPFVPPWRKPLDYRCL